MELLLLALWSGSPARLARAHGLGAGRNRLDDVVVPRAAAQIAFELLAYCRLVQLCALAVHNIDGGHDHARRAETALQRMILTEGFLHRVELGIGCKSLDRGQFRAFA